jgi:serine/threonine protein kinase
MSAGLSTFLLNDLPESIANKLSNLAGKYNFVARNDDGANGYVFFGTQNVLGTKVALKFYFWGGDEDLHIEPKYLTHLNEPNVLRGLDAERVCSEWAYFVTPQCDGGSLDAVIANLDAAGLMKVIALMFGILKGVSSLHAQNILHRDLKPANVFVQNGEAVIGDFGSVALLPAGISAIHASKHAILYRPPEAVAGNGYGFRGDVYQCGLILYQLLGGNFPYNETNWLNAKQLEIYRAKAYPDNTICADECLSGLIVKGQIVDLATLRPWVPDKLKRLLREALMADPSKRFPSVGHFANALHEARMYCGDWIKESGFLVRRDKGFRIIGKQQLRVQKKTARGWCLDNSFKITDNISHLVRQIDTRVGA